MARPIWMACGEKPAIYEHRQSPIVMQKHQQEPRTSPIALCTNLWLLKTPFLHVAPSTTLTQRLIRRRPRTKGPDGFPSECIPQHEAPLSTAPKEQDKGASSARTHSEGNPSGPGESHRAIDYPVFCNPAETPVTVERIRLMYSAFFSSVISSWFIRTSRRARTWAMDRAST